MHIKILFVFRKLTFLELIHESENSKTNILRILKHSPKMAKSPELWDELKCAGVAHYFN